MLKGHSKFNLKLVKKPKGFFVTKFASGYEEIFRLRKQKDKQIRFFEAIKNDKLINLLFEIPEIVNDKEKDDVYSFTMKFCNGKSILDILERGDITILDDIVEKIFIFLDWEIKNSNIRLFDLAKIDIKLNEIRQNSNDEINKLISKVIRKMESDYIPLGFCHGDLTLSNMIFGRKIALIDFLDSYIETPLQDIGKLLQEINLKWTLLMAQKEKIDITKIAIGYEYFKKRVLEELEKLMRVNNLSPKIVNLFYLIVLLRLFPYIKDKNIYKAVLKESKKVFKEIK